MTHKAANQFVKALHRHHKPTPGCKFCIGLKSDSSIVGVAICGRPVSRMLDDGYTLEVNRTCTNGAKNANSMLYGAAARAAKALGYKRILTYTLPSESGVSLKAAGWELIGKAGGGSWSRPSRERDSENKHPIVEKLRWEKTLT